MRKLLLCLLTGVAVLVLSRVLTADDSKKPGPPSPETFLKELFQKMDKNKDGKLTLEEFTEGMKELHKTMGEHARPMGPMPGPGGPMPGPGGPMPGPGGPMPGPGGPMPGPGGPMPGPGGPMPGPGGPMHAGPMPPFFPMPGMMPHGQLGMPMWKGPMPEHDKALEARIGELEAKLKALEAKVDVKK